MTTYSNNKALKPPFFFLSVMRVSRKLEYDDRRVWHLKETKTSPFIY